MHQHVESLISMIISLDLRRCSAVGHAFARMVFSLAFDVFPHVSHKICGGEPSWVTRLTMSWSLVNRIALASRADRKMSRSRASRSRRSLTVTASML